MPILFLALGLAELIWAAAEIDLGKPMFSLDRNATVAAEVMCTAGLLFFIWWMTVTMVRRAKKDRR